MRPGEVVLATNNEGKLRELQTMLTGSGVTVHPQARFSVPEVDENGLTFVENALLKARQASAYSGLPAIADDSGIAVDALAGAPGVRSARYAGVGASDESNLRKLLQDMASVPEGQRQARFHCVMVYLAHAEDPVPVLCHGAWEGAVLTEPQGDGGFGYDPVFLVPEYDCSSAELDADLKNAISHRGRALRALLTALGWGPP